MDERVAKIVGMETLTDKAIAADLLIAAKTGIKKCAHALSEAVSTDVRTALKKQLNDAINTHKKISNYMIEKGYYQAYDFEKQLESDIKTSEALLKLHATMYTNNPLDEFRPYEDR